MDSKCNYFSPRKLLLNLLDAADGRVLSATQAVRAGSVFDIAANAIRVTLTRLVQAKLVEPAGRGSYRLGPAARGLGEVVAGWREVAELTGPWRGGWTGCFTGGIARSDRRATRTLDRGLAIVGMRALSPGLFLRPDNLRGGAAGVRSRLARLGIGDQVITCTLGDLDSIQTARAVELWDGTALSAGYRSTADRLQRWLADSSRLDATTAARESYLLGDAAIRQIVFDPLLPAPLVDEDAREALIATMIRFDTYGKERWQTLLE